MTKGYGSLSTLKDTETRIVNGNRLLAIALVCLLTLLAVAVRMLLLGESLWVDELHTSWTVYDGLRPLPRGQGRKVLESGRFKDAVDADWQRSVNLGVTGVPTFLVGDRAVVGAQPYEVLEELVAGAGAKSA